MKLRYWLTLPERLLRALAATLGGLVYETSQVLLPDWVRRSRLYQALFYRLLRLTVELVGGVRGAMPPETVSVNELAVRKAAGNVIELASFLAVGWSPLWLLAAAADLTGGTRAYLRALVAELQSAGLLPPETEVASYEELLDSLEDSSGVMADMVDTPPLNLRELRLSWQALGRNVKSLPEPARLAQIYEQLNEVARQEGRPLASLSAMIATGAVRAGVHLGSVYVFDYYQQALHTIREEGWLAYAQRSARPYLRAAQIHLHPKKPTLTGRLLQRVRPAAVVPAKTGPKEDSLS